MAAQIEIFTTTALGDNTYLLAVGQDAALIDPQRDAWRFLAAAQSRGLTVRFVLEITSTTTMSRVRSRSRRRPAPRWSHPPAAAISSPTAVAEATSSTWAAWFYGP